MTMLDTKTKAPPKPVSAPATATRRRTQRREAVMGLAFIAPTLALVVAIVFYPIAETVLMSFSNVNSLAQRTGFSGLANYSQLFGDPVFARVVIQTVVWTVAVVGITTAVSIPVALALNLRFPGRRIARTILIVPWAASLMINALVWRWILDGQYSIANRLLMDLHLINQPIVWLGSEGSADFSLIVVGILVSIPFTSFSLLAGLQSIPSEVYEAARIDGAGFWRTLLEVTLPLLRPALSITTILNIIYVFNSFPIVWLLTQGAPAYHTDILVTYLYKKAFSEGNFGAASAMAVLTFLLLLVCSLVFSRLSGERDQGAAR
jgi:multiple sugar transport system permease protein